MKHRPSRHKFSLALVIALAALCAETGQARAGYLQTNLVSNIPGLATITDPLLVNPWGMSRSSTSPFWTSNQGTNSATLYAVTGSTTVSQVLSVNTQGFVGIPTTAGGPPQGPTGQVNNTNMDSFQLTPGDRTTSARFIFANLNGTISFWAGGLSSTIKVTTPGAVYTGLAINTAGTRLYAADSAGGHINVFDSSFSPVTLGAGAFTDSNIPAGFVPFNVQNIDGKIYVTYAPAGLPAQRAATPGQGFVDAFDENGGSLQRVITDSQLAAPWGIALAPTGFGEFGGDLLVGNFSFVASEINAFDPNTGAFEGSIPINVGAGNTSGGLWGLMFGSGAGNGGNANTLYFSFVASEINAFDPNTGAFEGSIPINVGAGNTSGGLWGLMFGSAAGNGGNANTLYFNDGINGETGGLFGALAVPMPATLLLLGTGFVATAWRRARRK